MHSHPAFSLDSTFWLWEYLFIKPYVFCLPWAIHCSVALVHKLCVVQKVYIKRRIGRWERRIGRARSGNCGLSFLKRILVWVDSRVSYINYPGVMQKAPSNCFLVLLREYKLCLLTGWSLTIWRPPGALLESMPHFLFIYFYVFQCLVLLSFLSSCKYSVGICPCVHLSMSNFPSHASKIPPLNLPQI